MPTNNQTIARVAYKLPDSIHLLLTFVQVLIKAGTGNPKLPNVVSLIASLTQTATALASAETVALTRVKGAVAERDARKKDLLLVVRQYGAAVQSAADADPDNSASIIESAGLSVSATKKHAARVFAAKPGTASGTANLAAPAGGKHVAYEWEYSSDGGKTWTAMPATLQAKTSMTGLTVATTVQFRYRVVSKTGSGAWSQATSMQVQ